jgi:hypothetical protein
LAPGILRHRDLHGRLAVEPDEEPLLGMAVAHLGELAEAQPPRPFGSGTSTASMSAAVWNRPSVFAMTSKVPEVTLPAAMSRFSASIAETMSASSGRRRRADPDRR